MKQNAKSAIFTRENGKRLLRQLLLLLPAWIVLALGIAMCVFSGVGSDTNTSFQQGLGRMLGLQTGTVTLIFNAPFSRFLSSRIVPLWASAPLSSASASGRC